MNACFRAVIVLLLVVLATPLSIAQDELAAAPGPYFVYLGSYTNKTAAQSQAAELGGWVLRTDLYSALTPGFYAAVVGPFRDRTDAALALQQIRLIQPDAIVRSGGTPTLPSGLGDSGLLAALLGELTVVVSDESTEVDPCAPTEPYLTVVVGFVRSALSTDDEPLGGFWVVERTGEVIPIRSCGN